MTLHLLQALKNFGKIYRKWISHKPSEKYDLLTAFLAFVCLRFCYE